MFGGEAESRFTAFNPDAGQVLDDGQATPAGCPNNPAVRSFVRAWADAAIDTGADHVFWDEPHWVHPATSASSRPAGAAAAATARPAGPSATTAGRCPPS